MRFGFFNLPAHASYLAIVLANTLYRPVSPYTDSENTKDVNH
jgi:hypothetical protein